MSLLATGQAKLIGKFTVDKSLVCAAQCAKQLECGMFAKVNKLCVMFSSYFGFINAVDNDVLLDIFSVFYTKTY